MRLLRRASLPAVGRSNEAISSLVLWDCFVVPPRNDNRNVSFCLFVQSSFVIASVAFCHCESNEAISSPVLWDCFVVPPRNDSSVL